MNTRCSMRNGSALGLVALVMVASPVVWGQPITPAAPSQSVDWNQTVTKANAEGAVTVYLALPGIEKRITDGFAKRFPDIRVTIIRQPTGNLITRLQAESAAKAPGADVAIMSDKAYYDDNLNKFTPLRGNSVALYKNIAGSNKDGLIIPLITMPFGIAYNPERIKQLGAHGIKSYEDLLQPQLKQSIGLTRSDITPVSLQWFYILNEKLGPDFLRRLAEQSPRLYPSVNPIMQAVGAGDLAAGLYAQPAAAGSVKDAGAPITDVYPSPKFVIVYYGAITDWAAHPAAAQVFMNWLASVDGQTALHSWGRTGSVLPDIKGGREVPSSEDIFLGILTPEQKAFSTTWDKIFLKR